MDYEQKYKEALERAKIWKDKSGMPKDKQGILDDIFPELKESKDEKIRNQIINFIEEYGNPIHCEWQKDWIAWLEEQGEHVEINPTEFDTRLQALIGKFETLPKEELVGSLSFWLNVVQNDGTYKREEKQGEQKLLNNDKYQTVSVEILDRLYESEKELEQLKQREQKPANKVEPKFKVKYAGSEYNVFETKDIAGITFYGIEDEPNHIDYVKADNCEIISGYGIKESGLSIPTKPVMFSAWSEEDERIFGSFLHKLEVCDLLSNKEIRWAKRRLKSLKPQSHWKPTEEQLYMLNRLATNVLDDGVTGKPAKEVLYSLYEQLKQL